MELKAVGLLKWIEIAVGPEYEKIRPGVSKRINSYNNIITSIYGGNVIKIYNVLLEKNGLNMDSVHWNVEGHKEAYNILVERIGNINNKL